MAKIGHFVRFNLSIFYSETVMRFCKKMGCEGFTELEYRLKESEEMQETKEDNVADQFGYHCIL